MRIPLLDAPCLGLGNARTYASRRWWRSLRSQRTRQLEGYLSNRVVVLVDHGAELLPLVSNALRRKFHAIPTMESVLRHDRAIRSIGFARLTCRLHHPDLCKWLLGYEMADEQFQAEASSLHPVALG